MLNKKLLLAIGLSACGLLLAAGYNRPYRWWPINDMTEQIAIKAFHKNSLRTPPEGSVSIDEEPPVPNRFAIPASGIVNPIPMSEESLAQGKAHFDIFCATCHGPDFGLSPDKRAVVQTGIRPDTGTSFTPMPAYPIAIIAATKQTDEVIYSIISNGGANMKRLDYHLSPEERWHVVNYVRFFVNQYNAQQQQ